MITARSLGSLLFATALLLVAVPVVGTVLTVIDPPASGFDAAPDLEVRDLFWRETPRGSEPGPLPRTLALALLVCLGAGGLGTALAWLARRADYPGRDLLCRLGLIPFALPSYLLAMTARETIGTDRFEGLFAAAATLTLATSPYAQLLVGAALARLDGGPEEAARALGASPGRSFRRVLLPRLRPALAYALLLVLLYTVSDFGVVDVLNCEVLTWSLYQDLAVAPGRAALAGLGLVALVLPLVALARLLHGRARGEGGGGGSQPRPASRLVLGPRGRGLAYLLHALQLGGGVLLPLGTLLHWVFPAVFRPESWDMGLRKLLLQPLASSLLLAAAGTALAIFLAAVPAWRAARAPRSGRRSGLVEFAVYASQALPGVLVGFGVLMCLRALALRVGGADLYYGLRQSGLLVVLGLGLRFFGQVYGGLKDAVLRLDRRQEEAARSLGAGRARLARSVWGPALGPGLGAAGLLGGLGILKELPITLMLVPAETSPLSYRLYGRYNEGDFLAAGLVGLLMAALALGLSALARSLEARRLS